MRRWISALVPAKQKPGLVEPPAPPMAGPSGQPAGIDHLLAYRLPAQETAETPAEDLYASLMPVRRLTVTAPILVQAPYPPESDPAEITDPATDEHLATEESPQAETDATATTQASTPDDELEPDAALAAIEPAPLAAASPASVSEPPTPAPEQPSDKVPPVRWDTLQAIAQKAMQQGDLAIAIGWWRLMRLAFPTVVYGYTDAALALAGLGRFDEGRQLLDEAAIHTRDEPAIPVTRALLEARAGNMSASVDGWRAAAALPTSTAWVFGRLVEALEQQSRHDEVDAVLRRAIQVPRLQHPDLLAKAVSVAVMRKDWAGAVERLVALGNIATADQTLAIDLDKVLVSLRAGDPNGLAAVVQAPWVGPVIASSQTEPYRLIGQARLAQLCNRLADTMARLAALRRVMPETADVYLRVEAILRDTGSAAAADAILAKAKEQFQDDSDVWIRVGDAMESGGAWPSAVAHWTAMGQTFPEHTYVSFRYQQAALRLCDESSDSEPPEIAEAIRPAGGSDLRDLALSFESLGGTGFAGGCEFGNIQRAWGAEPLGLLRWATVSPRALIACLEQRFEGVGDDAAISLFQSNESSTLLWEIRDERYGYEMHSFIPVAGMAHELMMRTACKRMRYLTDKLLRDLLDATKVFVFKLAERRFEPSEIEALTRGLTQYPGMRLLCVCPTDAVYTVETIETIAPSLRVAFMDFSAGHDWASRTAAWETLCRRVVAGWLPAPHS